MPKLCINCNKPHRFQDFCSRKCLLNHRHKVLIPELKEKIRNLYDEGKNFSEIGKRVGLHRDTVVRYFNQLNIEKRPRHKNFLNKKVGQSKVIKCLGGGYNKRALWLLRCRCGQEFTKSSRVLSNKKNVICNVCLTNRIKKKNTKKIRLTKSIWNHIKRRAKISNLEFKITRLSTYKLLLNQGNKCALSGVPIQIADTVVGHMKRKETTASLDRIDNSKGYIKGNVQWVHKDLNRMKSFFSESYFIEMCEKVVENFKTKT